MPDLEHAYLDHDLALLRAIAAQAGVDLAAPNARAAAAQLAAALRSGDAAALLLARAVGDAGGSPAAPPKPEARAALQALLEANGRLAAAPFMRRFGQVRPLGSGALGREQPWDRPANAAEALFFNGLIGRAFMDSETGPQEYFYVPSDLIPHLPAIDSPPPIRPAAPAPAGPPADEVLTADARLVDDAVTLLAAIQRRPGRQPSADRLSPHLRLPALDLLMALLSDLKVIAAGFRLDPSRARPFLTSSRADQLRTLAEAWRDSQSWNELLHVPGLRAEPGAWHNDPRTARAFVIRLCADLPLGGWHAMDSFINFVRDRHPDFQRPAGDYDSWYIRDAETGRYLRGFEHWDRVDGAVLRHLIAGPMHWLGLADLSPEAFRLTTHFSALLGRSPWAVAEKPEKMRLKSDGTLVVPCGAHPYDRFQAARIGEWLPPQPAAAPGRGPRPDSRRAEAYAYRITGNSLQAAGQEGITARHIAAFLRRTCQGQLPLPVLEAVERWGRNGIEARAAHTLVLRVGSPALLDFVRRSPKLKPFLGETIGELAIEVKEWERFRGAMMELGLAVSLDERRPSRSPD